MGFGLTMRGNLKVQTYAKIKELLLATISQTPEFKYSLDDVIGWLFEPHVIDALKQAFPYTERTVPAYMGWAVNRYPLEPTGSCIDIKENKFFSRKILVPNSKVVSELVSVRALPLYDYINGIQLLRYKFAGVQYVFDYFYTQKALPSIAYYWPVARLLIPDLKASKRAPVLPGLSEMLPFIRETSTILAATALLPKINSVRQGEAFIAMPTVMVDHMMKTYVAPELSVPIC